MYFQDLAVFSRTSDYLPILNAALFTDLTFMYLNRKGVIRSALLVEWYKRYGLSAVIADVLIIVIGIIIARYLYRFIFSGRFNILKFVGLAVVIQVIHDVLFYQLFKSLPRGVSGILDYFKDYAKEVGAGAILGDTGMIILTALLASLTLNYGLNTHIITFIVLLYLTPYFVYM